MYTQSCAQEWNLRIVVGLALPDNVELFCQEIERVLGDPAGGEHSCPNILPDLSK